MIRREKQGKTQLCTELLPLPCAGILNKNLICATISPPAPPLTTVVDPWGMVQQVRCGAEQQHIFRTGRSSQYLHTFAEAIQNPVDV